MKKVLNYIFLSAIILIASNSMAQPSSWSVAASGFANSMTFTWQVTLPESEIITGDDYLAAFVGEECRGVVSAIELNDSGDFYFLLLVHSNNTVGDEIRFRFYDASSEEIFHFDQSITFESEKIVGSFSDPTIFQVERQVILSADENDIASVHIFPNPTADYISIESAVIYHSELRVVDTYGKTISIPKSEVCDGKLILNVSQINAGTYYIIIKSPKQISSSKFIKI